MSILIYVNATRTLVLGVASQDHSHIVELGRWQAHNDVASYSNGRWPTGLYHYSHFNPHPEMGALPAAAGTAYGGTGIHVFTLSNRTGMGVHAGRSMDYNAPGGKTLGCIRVTTTGMLRINSQHLHQRLTHLYVANVSAVEAWQPARTATAMAV